MPETDTITLSAKEADSISMSIRQVLKMEQTYRVMSGTGPAHSNGCLFLLILPLLILLIISDTGFIIPSGSIRSISKIRPMPPSIPFS